ncbi:MAG: GNAT family N-acetyltransferase [Myxococcales bacterium]|nr:GNAT family N-acetyltransferase [Myxococcales bacterium]
MQLRSLGRDDLPEAVALLDVAGLAGAKVNLARYLRCQPRCGWAAIVDGCLVGLVTVLRQGTAAFVGAMAVHPDHRGARIGRRLLEHGQDEARRDGVTTFLLEATPLGEHLYRKLGYVSEHDTLIVMNVRAGLPPPAQITADLVAIARLDRAATGVVRDDMLIGLVAEHGPGVAIHRAGELIAFGMIVGDRLGPVLAKDPDAGREIVDLLAPACSVSAVPEPNRAAVDALARHGFVEARRLRRMRLGPAVPIRVDRIWALASPGAG